MTINANNLHAVNNMDLNIYDESTYGVVGAVYVIAWILAAFYILFFFCHI